MTRPTLSERHDQAVRKLADQYRREGFDVFVEPDSSERPEFLGSYRPDLIVTGKGRSIVVEASSGGPGEALREIAELVAGQPGWEFELLFIGRDPEEIEPPRPVISESEVEDRIDRARSLAAQGSPDAAYLLLWSGIDATLRLVADRATIPLRNAPTADLIRSLYSAGELDREVYAVGLALLKERNAIAHGFCAEGATARLGELETLASRMLETLHQPAT